MSSNNIERLVNCRFCANLPETGITGAPECDNWRYVKCSSGYCPLRYVLFTVDDWNGEWKGCAPPVSLPDAISVVEQMRDEWLPAASANNNDDLAHARGLVDAAEEVVKRLRSLSPGVATSEPTVEDCLRELRELFPRKSIIVSAFLCPDEFSIAVAEEDEYELFSYQTLSDCMAQVRQFVKESEG